MKKGSKSSDCFWTTYAVVSVFSLVSFCICLYWIITGLQKETATSEYRQFADSITQSVIAKIADGRYDGPMKVSQIADYRKLFENRTIARDAAAAAKNHSLVAAIESGIGARVDKCSDPATRDVIRAMLELLGSVSASIRDECSVIEVFSVMEKCSETVGAALEYLASLLNSDCEKEMFEKLGGLVSKLDDLEASAALVKFWVNRAPKETVCKLAQPVLEKVGAWNYNVKESMCFVLQRVECSGISRESVCGSMEL